jgi:hypothetical protein
MHAASIRDTVRRATQRLLRRARSVAALSRLLQYAFHQTTAVVESVPARAGTACAPGCAYCCYHPVDITPPEAFAIVASLQTTGASAGRETILARIVTQADRIRGLSYAEHAQARIPCALLVEGQCAVYPCRPFACRAWTSTSAARCATIFTEGDPLTMLPPLDMPTYAAVWAMVHGMTDGLMQRRLDGTSYELHSIVQRVLDTPDAVQRWLQGEAIFTGCTVGAFSASRRPRRGRRLPRPPGSRRAEKYFYQRRCLLLSPLCLYDTPSHAGRSPCHQRGLRSRAAVVLQQVRGWSAWPVYRAQEAGRERTDDAHRRWRGRSRLYPPLCQ